MHAWAFSVPTRVKMSKMSRTSKTIHIAPFGQSSRKFEIRGPVPRIEYCTEYGVLYLLFGTRHARHARPRGLRRGRDFGGNDLAWDAVLGCVMSGWKLEVLLAVQ